MTHNKRLDSRAPGFREALEQLLTRGGEADRRVETAVQEIIAAVRDRGDEALLEFTGRFDNWTPESAAALEVPVARCEQALAAIDENLRAALERAAGRIRSYAKHQRLESWSYTEEDGTLLGQQVTAMDRVGLYVPGGKAAYPSSVLMNALPAKVAGVGELVMVSPTPGGEKNALVLAAAALAGVDRVFALGGAQAVAALAYGTDSVPRVDKIVGPGNAYVAAAKRQVFGQVGIDMIAGPSEILVIGDGSTPPDWIALDLFAQAEHDELAQALLLSPSAEHLDAVQKSIEALLPSMPRRAVIEASLAARGALVQVRDLDEACALANRIAPEHLELSVAEPEAWLPKLKNAGAIFLGRWSSEAVGDYCAGPNHVLPTAGTARFSSPLGVYDFQKRSSLISVSRDGAATLGRVAAVLAEGEGLGAHARSARARFK
jgi:histidinol dehydrogenase